MGRGWRVLDAPVAAVLRLLLGVLLCCCVAPCAFGQGVADSGADVELNVGDGSGVVESPLSAESDVGDGSGAVESPLSAETDVGDRPGRRNAWGDAEGSGELSERDAALPNGATEASIQRGIPVRSPWARLAEWEWEHVEPLMARLGLRPVHAPNGLTVCEVTIETDEVFDPEDVFPMFLNSLHVVSRESVVRGALTFEQGDPFTELMYRDSERQLRNPSQYSIVLVLPVEGESTAAGCVDILVVTKDVWSLTPTWFFTTAGVLTGVQVGLVETNFLGLNDQLAATFNWGLGSWTLGPRYYSPRIGGTRWQISEAFDAIHDRELNEYEGFAQQLVVSRPLYESHVPLGWRFEVGGSSRIVRRFEGSEIRTYDAPETGEVESIDERWRERTVSVSGEATRSYGVAVKHNVSMGLSVSARDAEALPYERLSEPALRSFEDARLPREERVVGPGVGYEVYRNRWMTVRNVRTFGVGEEVRLGYYGSLGVRYSEPGLGATARFGRVTSLLGYRVRVMGDGWISGQVEQSVRVEERPLASVSDVTTSGELRMVSGLTAAGRLVMRFSGVRLGRNEGNVQVLLGGDTGLRGYPNGYLQSERYVLWNVEWRTRSVEVLRTRLGLVFFGDAAATLDDTRNMRYKAALGLGVRWMIPQLGTEVRALDIGFPLDPSRWQSLGNGPARFPQPVISITFGQVF
ncbi:MAG: hypothetical protein KGO50_00375 [Myxococcales bacterium]|nr:hypothetical protein [Myxococcales bacterium]